MRATTKLLASIIDNPLKILLFMLTATTFVSIMSAQAVTNTQVQGTIANVLCPIYEGLHTGVFIIGLALIVLGGVLYAVSHVGGGSLKSTLQGYGIGMIMGGIIGIIISVLAPFIVATIAGNSVSSITSLCTGVI
jgi:hypothetical protein